MLTKDELEQFENLIKPLKDGQERIEKTQQEQGRVIAQIKTGVEALAAGQQDTREQVKTLSGKVATKADMQDLDAKLVKRVNSHEKRIDNLEKEAGIPNPHKN